ncbi:ABC transporter permease [Deferribacteres bacterium DY0037]|nr:ABC transporter permease [Denitrovibrio acetiphilus]
MERFTSFSIKYGFLIVMAVLFVAFGLVEPSFWQWSNLFSILLGVTIYGILALGVTFTLVIDGLDLSVGSNAAMSVMMASYSMVVLNLSGFAAFVICIMIGAAIGFLNGFLIVKVKVPDLLATLGMMFLVQGLQLIPSGGRSIGTGMILPNGDEAEGMFSDAFLYLGQGRLFDLIPIPVIFMLVLAFVVYIILNHTRWGRVFYAIGGNAEAARLVGANVNLYRMLAYIISGSISALGGILLAARVGRGDVSSGGGLLLDAVGAALIGYAVLGAKKPNPFGTIVGAIFVGMLLNGLTMLSMPYYIQDFIKGCVLVAALAFTFGLAKKK